MKLYHYWRSSCSWRVRAALAAKGLVAELALVDIMPEAMGQDDPSYVAKNPMRQIPTLELTHGATTRHLGQSMAILEYLEECYPEPPLLPSDPWQRAHFRQIAEMVNAGIQPLQGIRVLETVASHGADASAWAVAAIDKGLTAIELLIKDTAGEFCLGDTFGMADIVVYPQLFNAKGFSMSMDAYPTLARIAENCAKHEAIVSTHPDVGKA